MHVFYYRKYVVVVVVVVLVFANRGIAISGDVSVVGTIETMEYSLLLTHLFPNKILR